MRMSEQIIFKICEEALREEKNESLFHKKEKKKTDSDTH